jgi:curved DNA-binding protein CbpA
MDSDKNYYEILGVSQDATPDKISEAHKTLALKYHPDKNPDPNATTKFQEIQNAFDTLNDPVARSLYDSKLRQSAPQPSTSFAAPQPSSAQPQFTRFNFYDREPKWDGNRLRRLRTHISEVGEQVNRLRKGDSTGLDVLEAIGKLQREAEQFEQKLKPLNELSSKQHEAFRNEAKELRDRAKELIPEAIRFNIDSTRTELDGFEQRIRGRGTVKRFFSALLHPNGHVGPSALSEPRRQFEEVEKLFGDYPLVQLRDRLRTIREKLKAGQTAGETAGRRPARETADNLRGRDVPRGRSTHSRAV